MGQHNRTLETTQCVRKGIGLCKDLENKGQVFIYIPPNNERDGPRESYRFENGEMLKNATTLPSMPQNLQTKKVPINRKRGYTVLHLYP